MRTFFTILLIGILIFFGVYKTFVSAPSNFPTPYHLTVTSGDNVSSIAHELKNDNVIRSSRVFEIWMLALGSERTVSQGEYYFTTPSSSFVIALRIAGKEFGIEKQRITFPEGYTTLQIGDRLVKTFPTFDEAQFISLTANKQGYLFPDTYKFFPSLTAAQVVTTLEQNYEDKVGPLRPAIQASGHSESDIIIMASLIEKEASGSTDSPVIAGILWKRLSDGMALQVDADPSTYTTKGLPIAPVDNPGLVAINAAIHPTASPYLYYLHDASGTVHYASTYQQHLQNIKKYLDKK